LRSFLLIILIAGIFSCNEKREFILAPENKRMIVFIQPFGGPDKTLIKNLQEKLSQTINADIKVLQEIQFSQGSYYSPRKRYWADSIIHYLQNKSNNKDFYLGIKKIFLLIKIALLIGV
jgi:predicted Zn-dependent protease